MSQLGKLNINAFTSFSCGTDCVNFVAKSELNNEGSVSQSLKIRNLIMLWLRLGLGRASMKKDTNCDFS